MPTTNGSRKLRWLGRRVTARAGTCSRPILEMRKNASMNGFRIARVSFRTNGWTPRVRARSWWTERVAGSGGESLMPTPDLLRGGWSVTLLGVTLQRSLGGAVAGGLAAAVWAA